jgi:hypothetical protein
MFVKMDAPNRRLTLMISVTSIVISVISFVTAFYTFYFTYLYRGDVDLIPPDRIGVYWQDNRLHAIIPITLTNTGSTRYRVQVNGMAARISTVSAGANHQASFDMPWQYEVSFITSEDFFTKYQEWLKSDPKHKRNLDLPDQLVHVTRAFPFQLSGGAFVSKSYQFDEVAMHADQENPEGRAALLYIVLRTNNEKERSWSFRLYLPEKIISDINYASVHPLKSP